MKKYQLRILQGPGYEPQYNVALDHALLDITADKIKIPIIRIWQNSSSVIIGRIQDLKTEVNLTYCKQNNIEIIRRISGGGTVYHDLGNINTSFIIPFHLLDATDVQQASIYFTQLIIKTLRNLGFEQLKSEGGTNVFYSDKKISGSAGHLRKGWFLHHATLLVDTKLDHLNNSLLARESYPDDNRQSRYFPTVNLDELSLRTWRQSITKELVTDLELDPVNDNFTELELQYAEYLKNEMYSKSTWIVDKKRKLLKYTDIENS